MTRRRLDDASFDLLRRGVIGSLVLVAGAAVTVLGLRVAYGAFDQVQSLEATVDRAGQGLRIGTEVMALGVPVGEVGAIRLTEDGQVALRLDLDEDVRVPRDARIDVRAKTLFGEKEVALVFPTGPGGPHLADGDRLGPGSGSVAAEAEELLVAGDRLFRALDPEELGRFTVALGEAARGRGDTLRGALESGGRASALVADTLDDQQRLIETGSDFAVLTRELLPELDALATEAAVAIPELVAAQDDLRAFLRSSERIAGELQNLLEVLEPEVQRLLAASEPVLELLRIRREDLRYAIRGLVGYMQRAGDGPSLEILPDGTRFGYFSLLLDGSDLLGNACMLLGASQALAPVVEAVEQLGDLSCGFRSVHGPAHPGSGPPAGGASGASQPGGLEEVRRTLEDLLDLPGTDGSGASSILDGILGSAGQTRPR